MILDAKLICSEAQSIAALNANDTVLSDKSIDFGAAGTDSLGNTAVHDPGRGNNIGVLCQVTTACTGDSGATVTVELVTADNEALDSNLVVLQKTAAIAVTALVAGYQFRFDGIPPGAAKRYVGFRYTNLTADMTAGAITAGLVMDKQTTFVG